MHLLSNMLGLYFFGREVGRAFGGRALLGLYLAGGLAGSLAHVAWKWSQIRGAACRCVRVPAHFWLDATRNSRLCGSELRTSRRRNTTLH